MIYMIDDVGCYVDGARGIYVVDEVVSIARSHGFSDTEPCPGCQEAAQQDAESTYAHCEFANEHEDEATDFMNNVCGVDGCYWGRSEQGDWGLWLIEEE